MEIRSDELQVITVDGNRHIIFERNVRVTQGDITLLTDHLEAFYTSGDSRPERLEAKWIDRVGVVGGGGREHQPQDGHVQRQDDEE